MWSVERHDKTTYLVHGPRGGGGTITKLTPLADRYTAAPSQGIALIVTGSMIKSVQNLESALNRRTPRCQQRLLGMPAKRQR